MNLVRVLEGLLYALYLTGLVPVLVSGELPPWIAWLAAPVVLGSLWARNPLANPAVRRVVNVTAVVVLLLVLGNAATTGEWLLNAILFVLFMGAVKLYQRDTLWDHYQVVALSFLQLLGAAMGGKAVTFKELVAGAT